MVEAAVKEGAVPSEDAAQWHISSGQVTRVGDVPGGMSSAIEHLREAPKTPETDLLRCATLRTQMDSLRNEAASLDVQGVDAFFTMPAQPRADGWRPPAGWRPLERFDDTLDGALVRVIPDRDEFQRLCERPAPGAVEAVEWCDDMEAMCGRHYAIEAVYSNSCGYELTKSDTDDTFAVPFDACMFVSRDTTRSSGSGLTGKCISSNNPIFCSSSWWTPGNDGMLRLAPLNGDALAGRVKYRRKNKEHRRQEPYTGTIQEGFRRVEQGQINAQCRNGPKRRDRVERALQMALLPRGDVWG